MKTTTNSRKFVGYYRVSTAKQGRSGLGLEAQRELVRQFLTVGADPNLSHRADPILSQGRKPTLRGSAVDKCRSLPGSLSSLSLS